MHKNVTIRPIKTEKSGKFQILQDRTHAKRVLCLWQKMWGMCKDNHFKATCRLYVQRQ